MAIFCWVEASLPFSQNLPLESVSTVTQCLSRLKSYQAELILWPNIAVLSKIKIKIIQYRIFLNISHTTKIKLVLDYAFAYISVWYEKPNIIINMKLKANPHRSKFRPFFAKQKKFLHTLTYIMLTPVWTMSLIAWMNAIFSIFYTFFPG